MRTLVVLGIVGALASVGCSDQITDSSHERVAAVGAESLATEGFSPRGAAVYEITVANLTSGQPLTPPLAAVHRRPVDLFSPGEPAALEVREIAENGNLAPMLARLGDDGHVAATTVAAGSPPPLMPGESITFHIDGERGAKHLSVIAMLICTNDGFTGLDGIRLPERVGDRLTFATNGYDAGTEQNTEDFADLVPPCPVLTGVPSDEEGSGTSDPALAENGVIHHHPGITGSADLEPEIHGWTGPVARIVVERVQ